MTKDELLLELNPPDAPDGICQCGCGQPTEVSDANDSIRGYVRGQPLRWIVGHRAKHGHKISVDDVSGCWNWTRKPYKNGYCYYRSGGNYQLAHRYTWHRVNGDIPPGLDIDHICRNRRCVNPAHLRAVTRSINMLAAWEAKRAGMR